MKKGQVINSFGNCLGFILAFLFFLFSACSEHSTKIEELEYIDTISLPFTSMKASRIYYHPKFKKTILTFIQETPQEIVSIDPETLEHITFPLDKINSYALNLSHPSAYYVLDSTSVLISYMNMKHQFFKVDRDGNIQSTISLVDNRKNKAYGLYYYSTMIPFPEQSKDDTLRLVMNFTADFEGNHLYITDRTLRNKKFSAKTNLLIKLCDSSMLVAEEIGSYPAELTDSKDYYYYEPRLCITPNNQIVNIFPSVNKIGFTNNTDIAKFEDFKVPQTVEVSTFNPEAVMDYRYISQYTYENSIWVYLYSDITANCYYAISTFASNFVNADGTTNDPITSPWILVTLDRSFKIIRTDAFSKDDLSKHNFFYSSKKWYILSNKFTQMNPNKYITFVKINKPKV